MDGTQALNRAWQDPKLFVPKNYLPKTGQRRCNCGNGCVYVCVWPVPWRLKRWLAASVKFTTAAAMHASLFVLRYLFVVFCCRGCIFFRLNIPLPNGSISFVCLFACLLGSHLFLGPFTPLSRASSGASGHSGDSMAPGASKEDLGWNNRLCQPKKKHLPDVSGVK